LLDYEKMFDELTKQNPSYWVWDGIHPTAAGHQKMADLWLNTVINSD
jgi:lysophospholipase L1-like esterase